MPGSIFARVEATLFTYAVSHMHCLYIWREGDVIKNLTTIVRKLFDRTVHLYTV